VACGYVVADSIHKGYEANKVQQLRSFYQIVLCKKHLDPNLTLDIKLVSMHNTDYRFTSATLQINMLFSLHPAFDTNDSLGVRDP